MAVKKEDTPAGAMAKAQPDPAPAGGDQGERVAELERENAELRRQLAEARDGGTVVRLETSEKPVCPRRIVISEGVWDDLLRHGEVQDPGTGYLLRRDAETGDVQVIDRKTGEPAQGVELAERRG